METKTKTLATVGVVGAGAVALFLLMKRRAQGRHHYSAEGSGWGKLEKGKPVDFDYVRAGQLLLEHSKQFKAKNIFKVTEVTGQGVRGHFVDPVKTSQKRMPSDKTIFYWVTELEGGEFWWPKGKYIVKAPKGDDELSALVKDLLPGVTAMIKAKESGDKSGIKKADTKIYNALKKHGFPYRKGLIPFAFTEAEKDDPIVLAKRISCIAQVKMKGKVDEPFGICRASVKSFSAPGAKLSPPISDSLPEDIQHKLKMINLYYYQLKSGLVATDSIYKMNALISEVEDAGYGDDVLKVTAFVEKHYSAPYKGKHPVDSVKPGVGTLQPWDDADLSKPLTDAELKRLGQEFMEKLDNHEDKPAGEKWDVLKYWDGYLDALVDAQIIQYRDRAKVYDLHQKHPQFKGVYLETHPEMKDRFKDKSASGYTEKLIVRAPGKKYRWYQSQNKGWVQIEEGDRDWKHGIDPKDASDLCHKAGFVSSQIFSAPGDKTIYVKSINWETAEDSFKEGEGDPTNSWDVKVGKSFDSIEDIIKFMDENHFIPTDSWSISEDYGMEASFQVDADNATVTEGEIEEWKKGDTRLWVAKPRLDMIVMTEHEFVPDEWKASLGKYQELLVVRAPKTGYGLTFHFDTKKQRDDAWWRAGAGGFIVDQNLLKNAHFVGEKAIIFPEAPFYYGDKMKVQLKGKSKTKIRVVDNK